MYRKTYIEINTEHLAHNVQTQTRKYPGYGYYIGVAKGNVYGHGTQAVKSLIDAGINYLAVSSLEEALSIRTEGIVTPVLLLQPIHIEDIPEAIKHNITITLSDYEYFKRFLALFMGDNRELKIHLKINSGFNRLGISDKNEVEEIVDALKEHSHIKLEGIYSHLATSGRNDTHFDAQIKAFKEITSLINLKEIPIVHLDRSLTLTAHEKLDFCTGARIGISMYGYGQSPRKEKMLKGVIRNMLQIHSQVIGALELKPAFSIYSEIIEIKKVKKGEFVGYGAAFKADTDCFVGCVSIGYSDGFFRTNKNGDVAIKGKRYQILAVDMGIMTILINETVKVYDKVELIGETISAKEVAERNGTTVYEILCAFKESVPRVLKNK